MDLRLFYFHVMIWHNEKEHERNAEWLRELTVEKFNVKQNDINITGMIEEQVKKILNWRCAELGGVQGFWLKKIKNFT